MAKTKDAAVKHPYGDLFAAAISKTRQVLANIGDLLDAKKLAEDQLSDIVVEVRGKMTKETTSKKTKKPVTVPVWDGRSPLYREWYNNEFLPVLQDMIPDDRMLSLIRQNVQNLVQAKCKTQATASERAHLGLSGKKKGKTGGNGDGDSKTPKVSEIRSVTEYPLVVEAATADVLAAQLTDLARFTLKHTRERVASGKVSRGERERFLKQSKSAIDALVSARAEMQKTAPVKEQNTAPLAPAKRSSKTAAPASA